MGPLTSVFQLGATFQGYDEKRQHAGQSDHGTAQEGEEPRLVLEQFRVIDGALGDVGHDYLKISDRYILPIIALPPSVIRGEEEEKKREEKRALGDRLVDTATQCGRATTLRE